MEQGRAARFTLSRTQLKSMSEPVVREKVVDDVTEKLVELTLTPSDVEKIKKVRFNDVPEVREFEGDSIFGTIAKVALPFIKKTLPKLLGTLGLAAATGAVSGATHKATSGKGLKLVGETIKVSKGQMKKMMELGNFTEKNNMIEKSFIDKMNKDLKSAVWGIYRNFVSRPRWFALA